MLVPSFLGRNVRGNEGCPRNRKYWSRLSFSMENVCCIWGTTTCTNHDFCCSRAWRECVRGLPLRFPNGLRTIGNWDVLWVLAVVTSWIILIHSAGLLKRITDLTTFRFRQHCAMRWIVSRLSASRFSLFRFNTSLKNFRPETSSFARVNVWGFYYAWRHTNYGLDRFMTSVMVCVIFSSNIYTSLFSAFC